MSKDMLQTHGLPKAIRATLGLAACFLALGLSSYPGEFRAEARNSSFCSQTMVHDYLAPLKSMAAIKRVPASMKAPFLPRGVSLYPLRGLRVGSGVVGFGIADEAVNTKRQLNMIISSSLWRVNARGVARERIAQKVSRIRKMDLERLNGQRFVVSGKPAFYRVDISFQTLSGSALGRYSEYFRVVLPVTRVRLALSRKTLLAGQMISARFENAGTTTVLPSSQIRVERYTEGQWIEFAELLAPGLPRFARPLIFGGEAKPCFSYRVENQPPGRYRFVNEVNLPAVAKQREPIVASFQVQDPAP